jgi:hypothetical protein
MFAQDVMKCYTDLQECLRNARSVKNNELERIPCIVMENLYEA